MQDHRLRLETLEARENPAIYSYTAASGLLTISVATGDSVTISQAPGTPLGYLTATDGLNTFDAATNNQPVKRLWVHMGGAERAALTIQDGVFIAGDVTVEGAKDQSTVVSGARVGGIFTFFAPDYDLTQDDVSDDFVMLTEASVTGRFARVVLGQGNNKAVVQGGRYSEGLEITSWSGDDTLELLEKGDIWVGGDLDIRLLSGNNSVTATGHHSLQVGGGLTYFGNNENDTFHLSAPGGHGSVPTIVGGYMSINLGDGTNSFAVDRVINGYGLGVSGGKGADTFRFNDRYVGASLFINPRDGTNSVSLGAARVGGALDIFGGSGANDVTLRGPIDVGGWAKFKLGGTNVLHSEDTASLAVGYGLKYLGGIGSDTVDFLTNPCPITVGRSMTVGLNLGDNVWRSADLSVGEGFRMIGVLNGNDDVRFGGPTTFNESAKIAMGYGTNDVTFADSLFVGSNLTLWGGKDHDRFQIAKGSIGGNLAVELRDNSANDDQGLVIGSAGLVRVGGKVSIKGGVHSDTIDLMRFRPAGITEVYTFAGVDTVWLDDINALGALTVNLGAGDDTLNFETRDSSSRGFALDGTSSVIGVFQVRGEKGADTVTLGTAAGQPIEFSLWAKLLGGTESDTLHVNALNVFHSKGNTEDFEAGDTVPA